MDNRPIGVFDSGLGGLTVVKELISQMPNESIVYFGDTGRVPYGTRSRETIINYAVQDINFLLTFDIKAIIIACGTASSVALDYVTEKFDIPIIGVVNPTAKSAVMATKNKKIGILGTTGTINSGSYQKTIAEIDNEITVNAKSCPLFVPLVENGYTDNKVARLVAEEYLEPLIIAGVDTIILGCTHYPLLKGVISDIMGSEVTLIDSGVPTSLYAYNMLNSLNIASNTQASYKYFVSDSTDSFVHLGSMFLNRQISSDVSRISIEEY